VGAGHCHFINAVRAARRIALDANPDLRRYVAPGVEALVSSDLSLGALPDGAIGHVFLSNLLEHLPDYRAALSLLSSVHRKLEPGGSVLILQPNFRLVPRRYFDFLDHQLILTDRSLVEALNVVGFEVGELRVRFLPLTSKSHLPRHPWLVAAYLRLRPLQWLLGGQTFAVGVKPAS
jgi:SAM-dependent methyltransferase